MSKNTNIAETIVTGSAANDDTKLQRPSRDQAMEAVRTLIRWAGDDPTREGLIDTPKRVIDAYREFFAGYDEDPTDILSRTFEDVQGYDDIVLLKNMRLESHCEHHMVPILGEVHIAYIPNRKVVGISKIARLVDVFGKRLQTQEVLTIQIAETIERVLEPKGVAVMVDAGHQCMTTRGVHKTDTNTVTSWMTGVFKTDPARRSEFMNLIAAR
jgi:GTP cyclohydrolase I